MIKWPFPNPRKTRMKAPPNYKTQFVIDRQRLVNDLSKKIKEQVTLLEPMLHGDGRTTEYRQMKSKTDLLEQTIRELITELHESNE
jgi:hypothetical protein